MRLFATARQLVGTEALSWPVPAGGLRARELVEALGAEFPRLRAILRTCRFLRNDQYLTDLGTALRAGDEFAVHPPYGGG